MVESTRVPPTPRNRCRNVWPHLEKYRGASKLFHYQALTDEFKQMNLIP